MITTAIFPSRYVQGSGALDLLGAELARLGTDVLVLQDAFVSENFGEQIKVSLSGKVKALQETFSGECCEREIGRLSALAKQLGVTVVVGAGGGKVLDVAKAVSYTLRGSVALAPTVASTDAPCSAISVLYSDEGVLQRYLVLPRNPDLVLVDSAIIAKAPVRLLVSGMGDALSTWFEAEACRLSGAVNMTGRPGPLVAHGLAKLCLDTLLEYGCMAKTACEMGCTSPALEKVIEANILLSGIGFESGGLSAAHAIQNGLSALEQTRRYYHGEKVAFGTLCMLILTDQAPQLIDEIYDFCENLGLPTTLADIGLSGVNQADLLRAAEIACAEGEGSSSEARQFSPQAVFSAMQAANAYGLSRRNCIV